MAVNVAAIIPVGTGAPIGDITVAAVVIDSSIDKVIRLETAPGDAMGTQTMFVVHESLGRLFKIKITYRGDVDIFKFEAVPFGLTSTPDQFMGNKFSAIARLPIYSKVVGFCPKSPADALSRTRIAVRNLDRLIRKEYPMVVSMEYPLPDVSDADKWVLEQWPDASPSIPTATYQATTQALNVMDDSTKLQIVSSGLIAQVLAAGVRAARILDLSELYPALNLDSNWGFGNNRLHGNLLRYPNFHEKGFRGDLTAKWVEWFEVSGKPATVVAKPDGDQVPDPDDDTLTHDLIASWNPPARIDQKGRETIPFDGPKAKFMSAQLMKEYEDTNNGTGWFPWLKEFVPSVHQQLKTRRLSGRQMFLLRKHYLNICG